MYFEFLSRDFYHEAVAPLAVLTAFLIWSFCVGADWLQGPYVYALYSSYGFSRSDISTLFVAGFMASGIFGCIVGSVTDRFGRKKSALAYCALYIVSCITKHFSHYSILMFGRLTGGMATSLLFSSFECWMVAEHNKQGYSRGLLGHMFGLMFTVMYIVAILCGFLAQLAADSVKLEPIKPDSMVYAGGDLMPFDLSILFLIIGAAFIAVQWEENYGAGTDVSEMQLVGNAFKLLSRDRRVWLLCVVVSCFEASMFAFVFNWTPVLESKEIPPPYGLIFALFMMACACGASLSAIAAERVPTMQQLMFALGLGTCALAVVRMKLSAANHLVFCFVAFLAFEFAVGTYFPAIGVMKSIVVPEQVRSTMYNFYRVPLNALVVVLLLTDMGIAKVFAFCTVLLVFSMVGSVGLNQNATGKYVGEDTPLTIDRAADRA
eukprot:TRINITY_DN26209_c0_g1_i1.p1 TRINITY_DN26209_c0_g1~~TRINITY_DN26209_c0_g1_i1.p1  ORF type:complete len:434 (+),score=90.29 TRINITY_DN26209_c0_g1_i1:108-1409(+)